MQSSWIIFVNGWRTWNIRLVWFFVAKIFVLFSLHIVFIATPSHSVRSLVNVKVFYSFLFVALEKLMFSPNLVPRRKQQKQCTCDTAITFNILLLFRWIFKRLSTVWFTNQTIDNENTTIQNGQRTIFTKRIRFKPQFDFCNYLFWFSKVKTIL